jgi:hypothetical protein
MRLRSLVAVAALALLASACGPHRPYGHHRGEPGRGGHHGPMAHGCGPGSCVYKSHCFSEGAARSNDGICQACNAGRWVAADGCSEHACGMGKHCDMGKGREKMPCMHKHEKHRRDRPS